MTGLRLLDLLDATAPGVTVGRHALWFSREGVKTPFQYGGRICKFARPGEATYDLTSLRHEVAILRALAAERMAPPVGDWVYAKVLVSDYGGARHIDPCGAYGYEMADARTLPPGRFSIEAMRALPIDGSEGAWNDIGVAGRDNVVNAYLVDIRRTAWDMLRWTGDLPEMPRYVEDPTALAARVACDCQFPPGERPEPYLDYFLGDGRSGGAWLRGSRRVIERAHALGFLPAPGESVLDLGCQAGGFLQYSWRRQMAVVPGRHGGIDAEERYLACGRDLARLAGQNLSLWQADLRVPSERDRVVEWAASYFGADGPDHLLALSLDKHIGEEALWDLVDCLGASRTYLESSAQRKGGYALRAAVEARGGQYVGDSGDRNVRRLYRIDRV